MPIITLTTDFGMRDPDLGHLKSRILQQIPDAQIIDISHDITPFDPEEAVYILQNALPGFPDGTIHLIAIDSETHKTQPPVLITANNQYFLGNDNGVINTALASKPYVAYHLPNGQYETYLQPHIEAVKKFLSGKSPESFAEKTQNLNKILPSKPLLRHNEKTNQVSLIVPKVIFNDHYGNAVLNLKKQDFEKWQNGRKFKIKSGHYEIDRLVTHYKSGLKQSHDLMIDGNMYARFNAFGYLEIFIYKSNGITGGANTLLGLQKNKTVNIVFED